MLQHRQSADTSSRDSKAILARARHVIEIEMEVLAGLQDQIDAPFIKVVALLERCRGHVIVTGMGKSGLIGRKIAATLCSTGTPALFLHPAEGVHGDLGLVRRDDVVLAISNSGETAEMLQILLDIKRIGAVLNALTGKPDSTLAHQSDAVLTIAVQREACPLGLASTASTIATLAVNDALAMVLLERRGFTRQDFALLHPVDVILDNAAFELVSDLCLADLLLRRSQAAYFGLGGQ